MIYTDLNVPFDTSFEACVKHLHLDEDLIDEYRDVYDECMEIARPVAVYADYPVEVKEDAVYIGGKPFVSKVMRVNFQNIKRAFPYVASCGRELYDKAQKESDPLTRWWIEQTAEAVLRSAMVKTMEKMQEQFGIKNFSTMNPGSLSDFPIQNQRGLFDLLGGECEKAGVILTDSFLMLPNKSGSGFVFETEKHYTNCSLCTRDLCPNRRDPFDEQKYRETYGL